MIYAVLWLRIVLQGFTAYPKKPRKIFETTFYMLSKIVCNINLSTNFQFESEFHSAKSVESRIRNERFFCIPGLAEHYRCLIQVSLPT
jgi:hypothetical protein